MSKRKELFDALFRHQVYLEGLKNGMARVFLAMLTKLYPELLTLLGGIQYATLDEMSLQELNGFLRVVQAKQLSIYNSYRDDVIKFFPAFVVADLLLSNDIYERISGETPKAQDSAALTKSILDEPMPANGVTAQASLDHFLTQAMNATLAQIRKGYANGQTPQETSAAIVGSATNRYRDGLFSRFNAQNAALLATILQHVSSNVQSTVANEFYDRYEWVAILDSKTTLICRSRNGTIYVYGKGPLPPAHYNCRSKAVSVIDGDSFEIPNSYYDWLLTQSAAFQDEALGKVLADKLRNGTLNPQDLSITTSKPLTLSEFASKIKFILGD